MAVFAKNILDRPEYDCPKPGPSPPGRICTVGTRYDYHSKVPWPSTYAAESTLCNDKPDALLGPERVVQNDQWVTHNSQVYDRKFYRDERDFQPKHPKPPAQNLLHLIRPDCHMKMQGVSKKHMKAYNPCPPRTSETHSAYKARYGEPNLFGPAGVFITDHFVHLPENRVNVRPAFTYDDMFSVLRKAHPYMTTYRIYHKNFEDELPKHRFLDEVYNAKDYDVAIKYRTRPMLDPFEQTFVRSGNMPSLDDKRLNPGDARNNAHMKYFFRRPPYSGCLPRVHLPVPHVGMETSYKSHYGRPHHPNSALDWHNEVGVCDIQPRPSLGSLMRTPAMYSSENNIYGSGRNVSFYVDTNARDPVVMKQERKDEIDDNDMQTSFRNSGCAYGGKCL